MAEAANIRFQLGQLLITPRAAEALRENGSEPMEFIRRHATGDWGELDADDVRENELALEQGLRLLSSYRLPSGRSCGSSPKPTEAARLCCCRRSIEGCWHRVF
jgi:hypothetical protein